MASLSLPRVLQLKKNSLDAEREQFEKFQTLAIQKAINAIEVPVKEKHVRSTIIGTFQEQSATTYWMVAIRLPLQDNRIVAWKFCHVTHKLLREGHPACLDDSQRHVTMIENLGKLWVHLREGYGKLVHLYCNLLVCKLKFHARNPRFPGNMMLSSDELDAIAENDVNNYFQICVELFDYMDDILNLQEAVFDSLGNARANSMTASGQCRLAALIPCAQDASHIYDCSVRLLFRLHAALPPDVAAGHRDRFRQQFKKLSSFYKHASSLQYYRNLLTLPVLPPNPPNFLLQSDFGTYVTPVVSIPEPPPDEPDSVASLIDTTDTMSHATSPDHSETFDTRATPSPQPDPIVERDRLIEHLQHELKRMRSEMSEMNQQRNAMLRTMRENVTVMESQLHATKNELEQEKHKSEDASAQLPQVIQKLAATEDRAKGLEEKFQKLKTAYTQLREEHIPLIRQKAEADKMVATLKAEAARHESSVKGLEQQLNDRAKDVELLQQSASSSEEIEAYKTEIANLRNDLEQSRLKDAELETLRASLAALEIEHNTVKTEQEDKVTTLTNELKETAEALERLQQEKLDKENELSRVKEELVGLREKSGDEYNKVLKERNEALNQVMDLKQTYQQEKEAHEQITNKLQDDINKLKLKIGDSEMEFSNEFKMMKQNFEIEQQHFEDVLAQKDVEINDALHKLETLQSEIDNINSNFESKNQSNAKEINDLHAKIIELTLKEEENVSKIQQFEFEKEKLRDTIAGLENERNSLTSLISEKETVVQECNIRIKELKDKEYKIKELFHDLEKQAEEKSELIDKLNIEKENLTKTVTELKDGLSEKNREMKDLRLQINSTNSLLEKQKIQFELKLEENNCEIAILNDKLQNTSDSKNEIVDNLKSVIAEKDKLIYSLTVDKESMSAEIFNLKEELNETQAELEIGKNEFLTVSEEHDRFIEQNVNNLSLKNEKLRSLQQEVLELTKEKEDFVNEKQELTKAYASEKQLLEARLEHTDSERLNAESELQDLLQHNTVLEADLLAVKKQLEDAQKLLEKERLKLVTCAGDAAVEVANNALSALERASAHDTSRTAAELAAKALEDLTKISEVKGNEESVARSAIFAAHNAAQLSTYVTEISNASTDMALADKLNNECRTMLTSTKQCLEYLKSGAIQGHAEAADHVKGLAEAAAAADRSSGVARTVDDELADMDRAIEEAASQIEVLLQASRSGDSGVKLEVNEKILDACTTLMGAVKILVQDARRLQNELGDPTTRLKMYRRNPQWSQGLISAAKAVVFAAKLLVTSADEAVATNRVEGVSAAAHEVAGSTAQLVAASRARAPPAYPALAALTSASRDVAAATGAVVAAVRAASALVTEQEALDTSSLTLTATRRLEMESKVRSLSLEAALEAERGRLAALRRRHYQLAQAQENGNMTNGQD